MTSTLVSTALAMDRGVWAIDDAHITVALAVRPWGRSKVCGCVGIVTVNGSALRRALVTEFDAAPGGVTVSITDNLEVDVEVVVDRAEGVAASWVE